MGRPGTRARALDQGQVFGVDLLVLAQHHGRLDAVRELVQCGADVNGESETGMTPLHLAVDVARDADDLQSLNVVRLLLELGADPRKVDREGRSALDWCATEMPHIRRVLEQSESDARVR